MKNTSKINHFIFGAMFIFILFGLFNVIGISDINVNAVTYTEKDTASSICTDTDSGNNIYEKGTTYRPSTVTPGSLFCKTDKCVSASSLKEYYCSGNAMMSQTISCANGCEDGACVKGAEPYCHAIGSRSEGWYQNGKRIRYENCDGCLAACKAIGSRSEGWYSSGDCETSGKLIKYDNCAGVEENCAKQGESPTDFDFTTGRINPNGKKCCEGLKAIGPRTYVQGVCAHSTGPGVCRSCGDGICDSEFEDYCNCPEDCKTSVNNEFISIAPDNWHFETKDSKQPFVPFGCNYFDPITFDGVSFNPVGSLDADRTDRHFEQLEGAGVNTVRIFLSVISLAPGLQEISEENFQKVDKIIELAKKHNLRIIFDIADGFVPAHYVNEYILERLDFLAASFAKRYADEPTIFAWDLLNEPIMMWADSISNPMWQDWARAKYITESSLSSEWSDYPLSGENWDNIKVPEDANNLNNQRLFDYQLFRENIAYDWVKRLTDAIRSEDQNHPITIGNIQWVAPLMKPGDTPHKYAGFNPIKLAPLLDFTSIHGYDFPSLNTDSYIDGLLRYSYTNKPVILEEFVYSDSTIDKTLGSASGWLAWACYGADGFNWDDYLFDSNEQITDLGIAFKNKAPSIKNQTLVRSQDKTIIPLNMKELLTDMDRQGEVYNELIQTYNDGNGPVGFVAYYPDDAVCTDTDNGNNIYEKGAICRPSTVTPGSLFCQTDKCVSASSLKEYYCQGDKMMSKIIACANGCVDGACAEEQEPEQNSVGFGWDYDLTKRCVKTTGNIGDENYYEDIAQCADEKHWLVAVESEKTFGTSCPGPQDRSLIVNEADSPMKLNWESHQSESGQNLSVNMKTDMINYPHPCGKDHFTWFAFMDQNGLLPKPRELISSNTISYNDFVLPDSAARCIVAAQFSWDGKPHLIEINVASTNWGDKDDHPGVIVSAKNIWGNMDYLALDGSYFGYQLHLSEDSNWKYKDTLITVDWTPLIDFSINEGYFDAPTNWENTATQSVQVASEVYNEAIADLWHTHFKVNSKSGYAAINSISVSNSNPKVGDTVKIDYTVENIGAEDKITIFCGPGYLPNQWIFSQYREEKTYTLQNGEQKADSCSFVVGEDLYQEQQNDKDVIAIVAGFHGEGLGKIWDQTKHEDITILPTSFAICTDTDSGNNIYEKGTICRPSTVTPGSLFCQTDKCASSTSLKEYYLNEDAMMSRTVVCRYGCNDGACARGRWEWQELGEGQEQGDILQRRLPRFTEGVKGTVNGAYTIFPNNASIQEKIDIIKKAIDDLKQRVLLLK